MGCLLSIAGNLWCLPKEMANNQDDSDKIVQNLKKSLPIGMLSIEQNSGRLLYNPVLAKLSNEQLKHEFFMQAMIINQQNGLHLVKETPFACFILSANELMQDNYIGFRQHETLKYIVDVGNFIPERVLICEVAGISKSNWEHGLDLTENNDYVFENIHSGVGEHFYYFLNKTGDFEMYM